MKIGGVPAMGGMKGLTTATLYFLAVLTSVTSVQFCVHTVKFCGPCHSYIVFKKPFYTSILSTGVIFE